MPYANRAATLVLCEALHRLARDLMVQESILHDMKRHGFELHFTQELTVLW